MAPWAIPGGGRLRICDAGDSSPVGPGGIPWPLGLGRLSSERDAVQLFIKILGNIVRKEMNYTYNCQKFFYARIVPNACNKTLDLTRWPGMQHAFGNRMQRLQDSFAKFLFWT
jgi:hypothetical protein